MYVFKHKNVLVFRSDTFKLNIPQLFLSYTLVGNNGNKQSFISPECFSLTLLLWHGLTPVAGKATVMWGGLCALIGVLGDYLFFWATDSLFVSCFCDHELLRNVLIVPCVGENIMIIFYHFQLLWIDNVKVVCFQNTGLSLRTVPTDNLGLVYFWWKVLRCFFIQQCKFDLNHYTSSVRYAAVSHGDQKHLFFFILIEP